MSTAVQIAPPYRALIGNVRKQAQQLYYSGIFVTDIVEHLKIDINDLGRAVFGSDGTGNSLDCWAYKKLHRPASSPITYEAVKPVLFKKIEFQIFNRVRASIEDMEKRDELFDIDEMSKAVVMIEKLDKITRLEEGKPTQHIESEHRTYTLREIITRRSEDATTTKESSHESSNQVIEGTHTVIEEIIEVPPEAFRRVPSQDPSQSHRPGEGDSPSVPSPKESDTSPTPTGSDGGARDSGDTRAPTQPENRRVHTLPKSRPFPARR